MVIEIKKLLAKGKYTGDFSFDFSPSEDKLLIPMTAFDGAVKLSGSYEVYEDDSVDVSFTVKYKLKGQCSYCLEPAEKDIEFSSDVTFVTDGDDGDNYRYDGVKIDMSAAVNDALLFSQPEVLLCKEGCQGIKIN